MLINQTSKKKIFCLKKSTWAHYASVQKKLVPADLEDVWKTLDIYKFTENFFSGVGKFSDNKPSTECLVYYFSHWISKNILYFINLPNAAIKIHNQVQKM